MDKERLQLHRLAQLYNIQLAYYDTNSRRKNASVEALVATLRALGASINSIKDAPSAINERNRQMWETPLEPVTVAWNGRISSTVLRLPRKLHHVAITAHLTLENGKRYRRQIQSTRNVLPISQLVEINRTKYAVKRVVLPIKVPPGYHWLRMEVADKSYSTLIISAPRRVYSAIESSTPPEWGVFAPLYAIKSRDDWGGGNFTCLERLIDWVSDLEGDTVATLPLLASFYEHDFCIYSIMIQYYYRKG